MNRARFKSQTLFFWNVCCKVRVWMRYILVTKSEESIKSSPSTSSNLSQTRFLWNLNHCVSYSCWKSSSRSGSQSFADWMKMMKMMILRSHWPRAKAIFPNDVPSAGFVKNRTSLGMFHFVEASNSATLYSEIFHIIDFFIHSSHRSRISIWFHTSWRCFNSIRIKNVKFSQNIESNVSNKVLK